VTTPSAICTRINAATIQKYLTVARCEGVASQVANGSVAGSEGTSSSERRAAYHQTIAEIRASSMMILTPVQTTVSPVG
jgi:hypothetical protein